MPDTDGEARVSELRRLVENGEYQIDPLAVAASLIRESETLDPTDSPDSDLPSNRDFFRHKFSK